MAAGSPVYAPLAGTMAANQDRARLLTPLVHYLYNRFHGRVQLHRCLSAIAPDLSFMGVNHAYNEALKAQKILEDDYDVAADVWSVTSYKKLYWGATDTERWNLRHPGQPARVSHLESQLAAEKGVGVAQIALAYVLNYPLNIFALVGAVTPGEVRQNLVALDMELTPEEPKLDGLVLWIFLNKKLNHWKSTRATAEVVYSLTHYLEQEGALAVRETATVTVGPVRETFVFAPDEYTGARNRVIVPGEDVDPKTMSTIVVEKPSKGFAFASATQDIVIDAYRIESAEQRLQGILAAAYSFGYRLAMITASAGVLWIAAAVDVDEATYQHAPWAAAYAVMSGLMLIGDAADRELIMGAGLAEAPSVPTAPVPTETGAVAVAQLPAAPERA